MLDINLPLIIAQIVTFLLALCALWLVAYKPIIGIFNQRAEKIKQDLDAAEAARVKMESARDQYTKEMTELAEKTRQIMQQAARDGQQARDTILQEARQQGQAILNQAEERIAIEREKAIKELRVEVVSLAIQVAEKVIRQAVNPELNQRLINETLDQLEKKHAG